MQTSVTALNYTAVTPLCLKLYLYEGTSVFHSWSYTVPEHAWALSCSLCSKYLPSDRFPASWIQIYAKGWGLRHAEQIEPQHYLTSTDIW